MMQELLGGGARLLGGERKIPFNGGILEGSPSSSSPSPSSSTTTTTNTTSATTTPSDQQNLRCPRCDSPNTKFCYYNNYNLTQPRHFCKTCRRYWTKGGALRNVPIGGGCRKNKTTTVVTSTVGNPGKSKSASDMVKSNLGNHGFDHETSSPNPNPILWAAPQNSHLLALLRSTQNPNPNPNPLINHVTIKEEGNMIGSHARTLSGDPLMNQVSPIGLCSSFWRNNQNQIQHHHHHQQQQQQQHGFLMGEVQNSGIQELYQRLRSSVNYYTDNTPAGLSSVASTSSSILESAPVTGGESGYWNPSFPWSDLPTTNGAYP